MRTRPVRSSERKSQGVRPMSESAIIAALSLQPSRFPAPQFWFDDGACFPVMRKREYGFPNRLSHYIGMNEARACVFPTHRPAQKPEGKRRARVEWRLRIDPPQSFQQLSGTFPLRACQLITFALERKRRAGRCPLGPPPSRRLMWLPAGRRLSQEMLVVAAKCKRYSLTFGPHASSSSTA